MSRRREQVLDAALTVLGADGARGLTYQAVDQAAGVPPGTTSNSFRNRAALMHGVLAHLVELDRLDWERFTSQPPTSIEELAEVLAGLARHAIGPGRTRTRARYALFLEAMARPELAALLARGRGAILDWGAQWLAQLDLPAPHQQYRQLVGYLDGVLLHQLTFPTEAFDPTPGFRAILTGGHRSSAKAPPGA